LTPPRRERSTEPSGSSSEFSETARGPSRSIGPVPAECGIPGKGRPTLFIDSALESRQDLGANSDSFLIDIIFTHSNGIKASCIRGAKWEPPLTVSGDAKPLSATIDAARTQVRRRGAASGRPPEVPSKQWAAGSNPAGRANFKYLFRGHIGQSAADVHDWSLASREPSIRTYGGSRAAAVAGDRDAVLQMFRGQAAAWLLI
jgi:hypothetical protein